MDLKKNKHLIKLCANLDRAAQEQELLNNDRGFLKETVYAAVMYMGPLKWMDVTESYINDYFILQNVTKLLEKLTPRELTEIFPIEDNSYLNVFIKGPDTPMGKSAVENLLWDYPHPDLQEFINAGVLITDRLMRFYDALGCGFMDVGSR